MGKTVKRMIVVMMAMALTMGLTVSAFCFARSCCIRRDGVTLGFAEQDDKKAFSFSAKSGQGVEFIDECGDFITDVYLDGQLLCKGEAGEGVYVKMTLVDDIDFSIKYSGKKLNITSKVVKVNNTPTKADTTQTSQDELLAQYYAALAKQQTNVNAQASQDDLLAQYYAALAKMNSK